MEGWTRFLKEHPDSPHAYYSQRQLEWLEATKERLLQVSKVRIKYAGNSFLPDRQRKLLHSAVTDVISAQGWITTEIDSELLVRVTWVEKAEPQPMDSYLDRYKMFRHSELGYWDHLNLEAELYPEISVYKSSRRICWSDIFIPVNQDPRPLLEEMFHEMWNKFGVEK